MITVYGILEYKLCNIGSKSEGYKAILKCVDGREYKLYRSEGNPIDDNFFAPYHNKKVEVTGIIEERGKHLLLSSIKIKGTI